MKLAAVFQKIPEGHIGFVEELPGASTQGATLDGTRANLNEPVEGVLESNRTSAEESIEGHHAIRELLILPSE